MIYLVPLSFNHQQAYLQSCAVRVGRTYLALILKYGKLMNAFWGGGHKAV